MSGRLEFSRKTRAAVHLRAGGCCELCGARLKVGEGEVDHILAAELGGDASIDNARLLCRVCHREKTTSDVRRIRKADRQRDKHTGAVKRSRNPLPFGRGSDKKAKIGGGWEYR